LARVDRKARSPRLFPGVRSAPPGSTGGQRSGDLHLEGHDGFTLLCCQSDRQDHRQRHPRPWSIDCRHSEGDKPLRNGTGSWSGRSRGDHGDVQFHPCRGRELRVDRGDIHGERHLGGISTPDLRADQIHLFTGCSDHHDKYDDHHDKYDRHDNDHEHYRWRDFVYPHDEQLFEQGRIWRDTCLPVQRGTHRPAGSLGRLWLSRGQESRLRKEPSAPVSPAAS
jgi:hypothetical protein